MWTNISSKWLILGLLIAGCSKSESHFPKTVEVVMYCSVDETYARPIVDQFSKTSGISVRAIFDSEAGKTTGLVTRMIAESKSGRPGADVFWSGELFGTMRLAQLGLLEPYAPSSAGGIPARFRDEQARWTASAARARVLAFDPARTPADSVPRQWKDLATPGTAKRVAIANPLFGTTRGHTAAMFALWGADEGRSFLEQLKSGGAQVLDSNSATVRAVIAGQADFAMTDSDDVWAARKGGSMLDMVLPDMGDGGTLMIPCSVALVKNGPNPDAAKKLIDFLASAEVETLLAKSESRNVPVRESARRGVLMDWPAESKVSFEAIHQNLDATDQAVREILIR